MSFWFIKYCRLSYLLKIYICNCQHSKPTGILNFFVLTVFCPFESATPSPMLSKNYELCKSVQPIVFFVCRISARKPEWARRANIVCSGSQLISEHRIHFILPTGTASYIITTIIAHTFASGKKSANELRFFTFITFMEKDNE